MNEVEYINIVNYEISKLTATNPGNNYRAHKGSAANHNFIIENVIDVLKGRNMITSNTLEGLKVVDIIERIYSLKN